jgi:hypothetical protein
MPRTLKPWKRKAVSFKRLIRPLKEIKGVAPLKSRGSKTIADAI